MSAKLIVIEGLDGSGKDTQTKLLTSALQDKGMRVKYVSFPDYANPASAPIKMYLSGVLGDVFDINAYSASIFYTVDRYTSYMRSWKNDLLKNDFILCNRYTTSNITHQMSKLPREQWDEFLHWIYDLEFNKVGIPKPAMVLYLDVAPEVSKKLIYARAGGDRSALDIHEKNYNYIMQSRVSALYAAEKLGWRVVSCSTDTDIREKADITDELMQNIEEEFGNVER